MTKHTHFISEVGETIKIGNYVQVTILDIRDGEVRLGIKAPTDVAVNANPTEVPFFSD